MEKSTNKQKRVSKFDLWAAYYFDDSNGKTFLNATQSAKAAGYRCSSYDSFRVVGSQNLTKLNPLLRTWLNEVGWTKERIKLKFLQLLESKKTERFAHQGQVIETYEDEDRAIQLQAAKFVAKLLKMEPSQKHEHSGPGRKPLEVTIKPDMTPQEAEQAYTRMINGD